MRALAGCQESLGIQGKFGKASGEDYPGRVRGKLYVAHSQRKNKC